MFTQVHEESLPSNASSDVGHDPCSAGEETSDGSDEETGTGEVDSVQVVDDGDAGWSQPPLDWQALHKFPSGVSDALGGQLL